MKYDSETIREYDLSRLRVLGSVGEPINPEAWEWYFQNVGEYWYHLYDYSTSVTDGIDSRETKVYSRWHLLADRDWRAYLYELTWRARYETVILRETLLRYRIRSVRSNDW